MTDQQVPTLVDPEWLEARLDEPDLRVLDCTVHLSFDPETGARHSESGYEDWKRSHVPNSVFADLLEDFSVTDDPAYPYQLPDPDSFADAMGRLGVGDDSRVVLYDAEGNGWAARFWWMLRVFGFDRAGVLDGGWERWTAEDRPVSTDTPTYEPASFTAEFRPELVADKDDVLETIGDDDRCLVNALRPSDYAGSRPVKYGRPGRIPDSVNVPAVGDEAIVDAETARFDPPEELRQRFEAVGVTDTEQVITYCGGGIAASSAALALSVVGVEDVAVYDGSLSEWGNDPELPMVTDE
jgi:thiosulfate/3-mercaptopyruvate sulfurtransferase